eukprot:Em0006g159a
MMSRGALLFGDGHLDGRTLWTGDKAEKLTSGVARKERNFLCGLGPRLVPDMRAMRVVVAAGEVVVGALVPILVPVVGLVQVAVGAVLQLLLVWWGQCCCCCAVVGAALLLLLLVAVGAALLLLLAADGRGAALHLAAGGREPAV